MKTFKEYIVENSDDYITIHRGESVHNKKGESLKGKYYSTDREFARQFTQSGQDKEIQTRKIHKKHIMNKSDVYAGEDIEPHLKEAKQKGYTPEQIYTIASIVEEETNMESDKGKIASVYLNRLKKGMKLDGN